MKIHAVIQLLHRGVAVLRDVVAGILIFRRDFGQVHIRQEEIAAHAGLWLPDLLQDLPHQIAHIQEDAAAGAAGKPCADMYRQLAARSHQGILYGGLQLGVHLFRLIHQQESPHLADASRSGAGIVYGNVLIVQPVQVMSVLHHFRCRESGLDGLVGNGEEFRGPVDIGKFPVAEIDLIPIRIDEQVFDVAVFGNDRICVIRLQLLEDLFLQLDDRIGTGPSQPDGHSRPRLAVRLLIVVYDAAAGINQK